MTFLQNRLSIAIVIGGSENAGFRVHRWLTQTSGGIYFGDILLPATAQLRRIFVHSADLVDGIQFEYVASEGRRGLSRFAGGVGGWRHAFEVPEGEELCAISGSFGRFLNSLQFHTESRHSHEYGLPAGERFFFEFGGELKFLGFFGREGLYLDSLGVVLENAVDSGPVAARLALPRTGGMKRWPERQSLLAGAAEMDRKAA